jgi:DNA-binding IclR family transcriptional regulator
VRNFSGEPVAAISISGPAFRVTPEKVPALAAAVMAAAHGLSRELGFKGEQAASGSVARVLAVEV